MRHRVYDAQAWNDDHRSDADSRPRRGKLHPIPMMLFTASLAASWYLATRTVLHTLIDPTIGRHGSLCSSHGGDEPRRDGIRRADDLGWLHQTRRAVTMTVHGHRCLRAEVLDSDCAQPSAHRYMICCNNGTGSLDDMAYDIHRFARMGFTVIVPTDRIVLHGRRCYRGMGLPASEDILAWIHEILVQDQHARIVLRGVSTGAVAVMMACGSGQLPPEVIGAIEECGYADAYHQVQYTLHTYGHLPKAIASMLTASVNAMCRRRAGYDLRDANCLRSLQHANVPMLFVQAGNDHVTDPKDGDRLVRACASHVRERLVVPHANHAACTNDDVYWTRVSAFIGTLDW